ncbi:hypothetical protein OS493_027160 [Desmophyllum pertusum]|uniref:Uncharacterized protein n=1 Tax=Desmophyllum pertusum TaxID=174260 RepID=A0A9W9ZZM4_9CNID|nr:hypothetical protein OS493_027160 [Desmophyllum pertusum]
MLGLEQLCTVPEPQRSGEESQDEKRLWADVITGTSTTDVVTKGKQNTGNGLPRSRLTRTSGPPLQLFTKIQEPKSAPVVEPNTNASQNMTSSDVGADACAGATVGETACGLRNNPSTHARACPSSKEPSHRTERHAREDLIPDGPLPAETVARATTPNGEALRRGDPARGEHSLTVSSDNSSSETQSAANGDSTSVVIEDENPEDDLEGHETCQPGCCLM